MSQVTADLYSGIDGPACKLCGRRPVNSEGTCAFCLKGRAAPSPTLPLSVRHAPTESYIAAHRIAGKVSRMHRLVIDTIAEHGPLTCGELEKRLGLKHQTVSARLHDLEGKNRRYRGPVLLYRTGARREGSGVYALIESQDPQPQGQPK